MIQLSDLDKLLAQDPASKILILDLKKTGKNGMRTLLTGEPREIEVKLMRAVMFYTNPRSSKYGQRKDDRQTGSVMFYDDYVSGNETPAATQVITIDRNSLSDPELLKNPEVIKALQESGLIPTPEPKEPAAPMTDAEMIEYLKSKGSISGNVKLKETESNPLDNQ